MGLVVCFSLQGQTTTSLYKVSAKYQQMGTHWKIIAYVEDTLIAKDYLAAAWAQLDALNQAMSDYDHQSELLQVCHSASTGEWLAISPALFEVLTRAQYFAKVSKGTFDVTVGPLSVLWRRAFRRQTFPDQAAVNLAKQSVNYRWLKLKNQALRLRKEGMRLDLGGIAKGYAVDFLFEFLKEKGVHRLLIDGGGDIRVGEPPPNEEAWTIQLVNQKIFLLKHRSIATSGATYKYLEHNGIRYSHIINPRTGYGHQGNKLVTILSERCQDADALASIISLLNDGQQKRLAKKMPFDFELHIIE